MNAVSINMELEFCEGLLPFQTENESGKSKRNRKETRAVQIFISKLCTWYVLLRYLSHLASLSLNILGGL